MTLPYSSATSGTAALEEVSKILKGFGCTRFGTMTDTAAGELIVQFTVDSRDVTVKASIAGYAAAWLKENPYTSRRQSTEKQHRAKALAQAEISVCSILRDWIKGQVTAVQVGMLSFEAAFLAQLTLPNGKTVLEHTEAAGLLRLEDRAP